MTVVPFKSLVSGFLHQVREHAERISLEIGDAQWTYGDLWNQAGRLSPWLVKNATSQPLIAVLAKRNLAAFSSIVGILAAAKGYVPLNPKFPLARLHSMLLASECKTLVFGAECAELVEQLLDHHDGGFLPVCIDAPSALLSDRLRASGALGVEALQICAAPDEPTIQGTDVAYLLFTSGSTGQPKGVPLSHANAIAYMRQAESHYRLVPSDRCSQTFDLTFDLSVHDMFVCWNAGATLCPIPDAQLMLPAHFIRQRRITVWFSVPSIASSLSKAKLLKPNAFPLLRLSLFCGEPLKSGLAIGWQVAAPNSLIENLYGPTETTIAITRFRWTTEAQEQCVNGIVPIGTVFPLHQIALVPQHAESQDEGELCLSGPQVASGYWNAPARTERSFTKLPGLHGTWYHTGDLVRRDQSGCLYYLGRLDDQVKIAGFRVELQEVETVLRAATGCLDVVALAWPFGDANPTQIVAVISGECALADSEIVSECSKTLASYMVPRQVFRMADLPLNANGKLDRRAVVKRLVDE